MISSMVVNWLNINTLCLRRKSSSRRRSRTIIFPLASMSSSFITGWRVCESTGQWKRKGCEQTLLQRGVKVGILHIRQCKYQPELHNSVLKLHVIDLLHWLRCSDSTQHYPARKILTGLFQSPCSAKLLSVLIVLLFGFRHSGFAILESSEVLIVVLAV
jgi:hypothetical protein